MRLFGLPAEARLWRILMPAGQPSGDELDDSIEGMSSFLGSATGGAGDTSWA